jgi:hypothetical protein
MLGVPFFHLSEILKIDFEGVVSLIKKMNADLYYYEVVVRRHNPRALTEHENTYFYYTDMKDAIWALKKPSFSLWTRAEIESVSGLPFIPYVENERHVYILSVTYCRAEKDSKQFKTIQNFIKETRRLLAERQ